MTVAIIGGTGLAALADAQLPAASGTATPYGEASALPRRIGERPAVFLNRHGERHALAPHAINYRANLWLLNALGAQAILAVFAVGAIERGVAAGALAVPEQIIDYTWGREHTFSAPGDIRHADFTHPFDPSLRARLLAAAEAAGVAVRDGGVYGAVQGPRLETAAEIDRMERDGCTLVGMTAMPEAILARELGIPYAGICLAVNAAAGRGDAGLNIADMRKVVEAAAPKLARIAFAFLDGVAAGECLAPSRGTGAFG